MRGHQQVECDQIRRWRKAITAIGGVAMFSGLFFIGCAADPQKPVPLPSEQIRKDSDQFFDKMKQEERERGKGMEEMGK